MFVPKNKKRSGLRVFMKIVHFNKPIRRQGRSHNFVSKGVQLILPGIQAFMYKKHTELRLNLI